MVEPLCDLSHLQLPILDGQPEEFVSVSLVSLLDVRRASHSCLLFKLKICLLKGSSLATVENKKYESTFFIAALSLFNSEHSILNCGILSLEAFFLLDIFHKASFDNLVTVHAARKKTSAKTG